MDLQQELEIFKQKVNEAYNEFLKKMTEIRKMDDKLTLEKNKIQSDKGQNA